MLIHSRFVCHARTMNFFFIGMPSTFWAIYDRYFCVHEKSRCQIKIRKLLLILKWHKKTFIINYTESTRVNLKIPVRRRQERNKREFPPRGARKNLLAQHGLANIIIQICAHCRIKGNWSKQNKNISRTNPSHPHRKIRRNETGLRFLLALKESWVLGVNVNWVIQSELVWKEGFGRGRSGGLVGERGGGWFWEQ